jgi:hypothetical protein
MHGPCVLTLRVRPMVEANKGLPDSLLGHLGICQYVSLLVWSLGDNFVLITSSRPIKRLTGCGTEDALRALFSNSWCGGIFQRLMGGKSEIKFILWIRCTYCDIYQSVRKLLKGVRKLLKRTWVYIYIFKAQHIKFHGKSHLCKLYKDNFECYKWLLARHFSIYFL